MERAFSFTQIQVPFKIVLTEGYATQSYYFSRQITNRRHSLRTLAGYGSLFNYVHSVSRIDCTIRRNSSRFGRYNWYFETKILLSIP